MGARILLVDDEAELRALWREMLEAAGHEVVEAGSVDEARARLAPGARFDVAVVDWTLPDGKGSAVRDAISDSGLNVPLVYATGIGPILPSGHGADRVLAKPFRMRALLDAVRELTEGS